MRSKRYKKEKLNIKNKIYSPLEAIQLIKKISKVKFDPSLEIHLNLRIDPSKESVRGTVKLPHNIGRKLRIACFVSPGKEKEAKDAGADIVGGEDLIKKISQTKKCDFDIALAMPQMMRHIAPIAKILGQKGLMPNPKAETVVQDIGRSVKEIKEGKIMFKNDDTGNIHQILGKLSSEDNKLLENLEVFVEAVKNAKPEETKGELINNAVLCSTMGPGVKIDINNL